MASNRGLLPDLSQLKVSPSQITGDVVLENDGDAHAFPVWEVRAPASRFRAVSPDGAVLEWTGALAAGQTLTIDTEKGTVVDNTGANRYAELSPAPRMWTIPPGITSAAVEVSDSTSASRVTVRWRPRRWVM